MSIDREALFKPRLEEAEVDLEGMGTVRVRGLSRGEVIAMRKATDTEANLDGPRALVIERKMIALAMIDPKLTETEVARWQEAAPAGELEPVTAKIQELSGLSEGANKSGLPGAGGEPGAGVRALPGGEAVDDGERAPGSDEQ